MREVVILADEPTIAVIAEMQLDMHGVGEMLEWVKDRRPACVSFDTMEPKKLFPHNLTDEETHRPLTSNELLVELAGRKCYDSFGEKAGKKSNKEYIANTQQFDPPHASILYHAKISFFFGGVSRRVSHEMIRNYVGADRSEEGCPSQESTRYVEHAGRYVAHPWILEQESELAQFKEEMQKNYDAYLLYIQRQQEKLGVGGRLPTQIRKRIFESASSYLSHSCETSWVWTTNPAALAKLFKERCADAADLEFSRFARKLRRICVDRYSNLFPQPWCRGE